MIPSCQANEAAGKLYAEGLAKALSDVTYSQDLDYSMTPSKYPALEEPSWMEALQMIPGGEQVSRKPQDDDDKVCLSAASPSVFARMTQDTRLYNSA